MLTEDKTRDGALEEEDIADDGAAAAWGGGNGIDTGDVGETLGGLCIDGGPHEAWRPELCVLSPASTSHAISDVQATTAQQTRLNQKRLGQVSGLFGKCQLFIGKSD